MGAENAEEYFHRGAQFHIHAKDKEAKTEIFTGLQKFPEDPLLNGLAGLLKEQEKQQQQQNQQQKQDQQKDQNQEQQQQQGQQQPQQNPEAEKDSSQQQQAEQQKQDEQKQEQKQAQQSTGEPKENSDEKDQKEGQAYAAGQMTPEQANQLLDAQKGEEQMLQLKPEGKPAEPNRPIRDW